jgi:photosynthetic reaction center cytochrome c subunit
MSWGLKLSLGSLAVVTGTLLTIAVVNGFERPPVQTAQGGFRGTGIDENYNPRTLEALHAANTLPAVLPPFPAAGPKASAVYKNVPVLGALSVGQFTRLMASITTWVAPKQGCAYCHDTKNMAADTVYTKVVSRRMLQMVQHINADWKPHVAATGVTCYTCHRGNPVPAGVWYNDTGTLDHRGIGRGRTPSGQNRVALNAAFSSLPYDPLTPFLEESNEIRVQPTTALPNGSVISTKQTEWTYALMMNFSQALGVNCTYCHNSRSFFAWDASTPQRATAWYGIRMVRDLNNNFLKPLQPKFPAVRLGPDGDGPKLACVTCHQGVYKPLFGVNIVNGYPELKTVVKQ